MTSYEHKLKNAYLGDPIKMIECDFTEGDQGFTFNRRINSTDGRDSGGRYTRTGSARQGMASRSIPSDVYSAGDMQKIVFFFNCSTTQSGGGLSKKGGDTYVLRSWATCIELAGWGTGTQSVTIPSGEYEFTIDFENKKAFISTAPTTTLTLSDSTITAIKSDITNGNMCICGVNQLTSATVHIKKVQFYYE